MSIVTTLADGSLWNLNPDDKCSKQSNWLDFCRLSPILGDSFLRGALASLRDEKLPLSAAGSCEPGQALTGAALSIRFRVRKGVAFRFSQLGVLSSLRRPSFKPCRSIKIAARSPQIQSASYSRSSAKGSSHPSPTDVLALTGATAGCTQISVRPVVLANFRNRSKISGSTVPACDVPKYRSGHRTPAAKSNRRNLLAKCRLIRPNANEISRPLTSTV